MKKKKTGRCCPDGINELDDTNNTQNTIQHMSDLASNELTSSLPSFSMQSCEAQKLLEPIPGPSKDINPKSNKLEDDVPEDADEAVDAWYPNEDLEGLVADIASPVRNQTREVMAMSPERESSGYIKRISGATVEDDVLEYRVEWVGKDIDWPADWVPESDIACLEEAEIYIQDFMVRIVSIEGKLEGIKYKGDELYEVIWDDQEMGVECFVLPRSMLEKYRGTIFQEYMCKTKETDKAPKKRTRKRTQIFGDVVDSGNILIEPGVSYATSHTKGQAESGNALTEPDGASFVQSPAKQPELKKMFDDSTSTGDHIMFAEASTSTGFKTNFKDYKTMGKFACLPRCMVNNCTNANPGSHASKMEKNKWLKHCQGHLDWVNQKYYCEECEISYFSATGLKTHVKKAHKRQDL